MKRIYERDQSRGEIYRTITDEKLADSIVMALDETNFQELLLISKSYGLPNGFDDVYNAGGIVELVLLHCGKNPSGFQDRWDAIMPFINQTFDLDKGDNGFTYIYDMTSRLHFGVQYYGTLPLDEVPVKDMEGLQSRRIRYCLQ